MAALLLVSCEKWTYTSRGKPISFTASQTAINWTSDDVIRIFCPQAFGSGSEADYTIQGSTLTPKGTQLRWGDGIHSFYAVYPAGEISGNVVSANIPSTQSAVRTPLPCSSSRCTPRWSLWWAPAITAA